MTELEADLATLLHWQNGPGNAVWVADYTGIIAALRDEGKTDIEVLRAIAQESHDELIRSFGYSEVDQPTERAVLISGLWHETQIRLCRLPEPRRVAVWAALFPKPSTQWRDATPEDLSRCIQELATRGDGRISNNQLTKEAPRWLRENHLNPVAHKVLQRRLLKHHASILRRGGPRGVALNFD